MRESRWALKYAAALLVKLSHRACAMVFYHDYITEELGCIRQHASAEVRKSHDVKLDAGDDWLGMIQGWDSAK